MLVSARCGSKEPTRHALDLPSDSLARVTCRGPALVGWNSLRSPTTGKRIESCGSMPCSGRVGNCPGGLKSSIQITRHCVRTHHQPSDVASECFQDVHSHERKSPDSPNRKFASGDTKGNRYEGGFFQEPIHPSLSLLTAHPLPPSVCTGVFAKPADL